MPDSPIQSRSLLRKSGLIAVLLLCTLASWPFWSRPSLPRETDAELHVFRTAQLAYTIQEGALYPRWAPDFYYGYGYPIFNYYAPLSYYVANLLTAATPTLAVTGVKAVFILAIFAAGLGTYGAIRELTGDEAAGVAGAAAYLFAPYILTIDPHLRGVLAESLALGLAPLALWAQVRHLRLSNGPSTLLASLAVAAVILSHNLMGPLIFALLLSLSIWITILQPPSEALTSLPGRLASALLPLGLSIALTSFFWVPVALESSAVQLGNLIGPGHFDFRNHFVPLAELFAPSLPLDLGAVNPAFRFNVGVAQWLLPVAGALSLIIGLLRQRPPERSVWIARVFWWVAALSLILLISPLGQPIWEALPPMAFIQFPWRLLGPLALCLGILVGYSLVDLRAVLPEDRQHLLPWLSLIFVALALPIFSPPGWGDFGPTDRQAMLDFELNGLALGTTSTGDYVPAQVDVVPGPNPDLLASYEVGPIDRVNRVTLPPDAAVEQLDHQATSMTFMVSSDEFFVLRLYHFYFPGWRATIDDQPVDIEIARPEGFMTLPIPPGQHEVRVWLGLTPVRRIASVLSFLTLAALALIAWRWQAPAQPDRPTVSALDIDLRWLAAALAAMLVIGWTGVVQPRSSGLEPIPMETAHHRYLQGGVDFLGYDLPRTTVRPGDQLDLTLYWQAREPVAGNYQTFVHLTTLPQHTWGQLEKLNPGDYPTTRWPLQRYVRDDYQLVVPLGTPPGEYTLRAGLWDLGSGARQLVLEEDGTILGDAIALPITVTVLPARRQPSSSELPLTQSIDQQTATGIVLLGTELLDGPSFRGPAGYLRLALYWQSTTDSPVGDAPSLRIINGDDQVLTELRGTPADGLAPFDRLESGQVLRDLRSIWLDETVAPGTYRWQVQLQDESWLTVATFDRSLPDEQ
ncbi:MAG: hypothetical protein GYB68_12985 [Chloroflexi bacterium]|nr:hypothetical protein [Chloroflexota bacterium]